MGPVIAVTGVAFEARIAAGAGIFVICGADRQRLVASLEQAIANGVSGILSFGVAGGLDPELAPGDWVVANAIIGGEQSFATDPRWTRNLLQSIAGARSAVFAGVDEPVMDAPAKRTLREATGAVAVDMESHIAAALAAAHHIPFAACRVILDPAGRSLPPAALAGRNPDGTSNLKAVLRSLVLQPGQLPDLIQVALDARKARLALARGRHLLGAGLGLPDFD